MHARTPTHPAPRGSSFPSGIRQISRAAPRRGQNTKRSSILTGIQPANGTSHQSASRTGRPDRPTEQSADKPGRRAGWPIKRPTGKPAKEGFTVPLPVRRFTEKLICPYPLAYGAYGKKNTVLLAVACE